MPRKLILLLFPLILAASCDRPTEPEAPETAEPASAPAEPEPSPAEPEPAEKATVPTMGLIDIEAYVEHLRTLSSDEFEGRAPGSPGERLTLDYLSGQFEELGLEPGYDDSYLQPVSMVEITNEHRSDLAISVGDDEMTLSYPDDMITWSRREGRTHGIEDSELVFVGYGVVAPEYDWNDYEGLDVEGKTVVILVNDPGFATGDENLFNGRSMTYYGRWTYKYEEAARQGAAAALIVHETEPASYPWEVVTGSWSGTQFDLPNGDGETVALEGWITVDAARDLFERAGMDYDEAKEAAKQSGFQWQSFGATASADIEHSMREGTSYNVLGLLPGSERPEEVVVYMAHWDHLGRDFSRPGSAGIFNGAIDNATGTAGLLEMARVFSEAEAPERSVLFLAVTLEESGLLGSAHYINDPVFPHNMTAAAINMDAMSLVGPTRDVVVVGYGNSELDNLLHVAAVAQDRHLVPEPTPEGGYYYRSDHFNFAKAGIPALYAKGGVDHIEHGRDYGLELQREYTANRYHKPADEFNPDWDFRGVAQDLELLYRVGHAIADAEGWPRWTEGNEFRAIREASGR